VELGNGIPKERRRGKRMVGERFESVGGECVSVKRQE
jgi:hypothetical protein